MKIDMIAINILKGLLFMLKSEYTVELDHIILAPSIREYKNTTVITYTLNGNRCKFGIKNEILLDQQIIAQVKCYVAEWAVR